MKMWQSQSLVEHLPGQHDQKTHGQRTGVPSIGEWLKQNPPLTPQRARALGGIDVETVRRATKGTTVTVYHGTDTTGAKAMKSTGVLKGTFGSKRQWGFALSPTEARHFGTRKAIDKKTKPVLLRIALPAAVVRRATSDVGGGGKLFLIPQIRVKKAVIRRVKNMY